MTEPEENTEAERKMLPPGEYPIWSLYASNEAAATLMQAFDDDETMC